MGGSGYGVGQTNIFTGKRTYNELMYMEVLNGNSMLPYGTTPAAWGGDMATVPAAADWDRFDVMHDVAANRSQNTPSPFTTLTATDPSGKLSDIEERLQDLTDGIDDLDPEQDIGGAIDEALSRYDAAFDSSSRVSAIMDSSEQRSQRSLQRTLSSIQAGMFDIRAIMNTQFGMALALAVSDHQDQLNDTEARLVFQLERERSQATITLAQMIQSARQHKIAALQSAVGSTADTARIDIAARQDQIEKDLEYALKDRMWDLSLYDNVYRMMGSLGGGVNFPATQSVGQRLVTLPGAMASSALAASATMGPEGGMMAAAITGLGGILSAFSQP